MKSMKRICLLLFAVFVAAGCHRGGASRSHHPGAPVIIISIDTLRADHLPMFGYRNVDTPALDALREDSILYTNAFSAVPLTLPSHTAMLTGLLPPSNQVRNNIGYRLDPALPTIPKALKSKGYDTGAAVSAYVLRGSAGLAPSFDFYDDGVVTKANTPIGTLQRPGSDTAAVAKRWIGEHKGKPFFFFLHLFEPHSPYEPIEPFRSRYANQYDGEIATADQIVGDFIDDLKATGLYDTSIIILMSDHGEGLSEHGEPEHGIFLYREAIHVPLLVKLPERDRAGETDAAPVSLVDIFPTVTELTEATPPAKLQGKSLLHHDAADADRRIYSETLYPRIHLGWSELRSLEGAQYHYIEAPRPELYDMKNDPGEKQSVLAEQRRTYAAMRDELTRYGNEITLPSHMDPEEAKNLAALGYLGAAAGKSAGPLPDPKDRIGEITEMMAATKLAMSGKHEEAIAAFRHISEENPRLTDAWQQLSTELEVVGRYDEAAEACRKAITIAPDLAGEFGLRLAALYLKLERFDDAEKHAKLGEKVNYGSSHVLLARIALAKKDYAKAAAEAQLAGRDEFAHLPALVLQAQIEAQQNHAQRALELVQQVEREAEERHLGNVETLNFVKGDAYARMQRFDESITAFKREIELFPLNRQTYASLYIVYMLTGRPAEANQTLESMAAASPSRRTYLFAAHTVEAVNDIRTAEAWKRRSKALR
jgi:arylsulfatase A-like enzyme/Flp pilus assembly protein TadD